MKFWESNHQSVQEGDMQFIALYKFYYQDLYAYGVSLGFNTEDVKDAIQEVYLKLYFNERLCIDEKKIKFGNYIQSYSLKPLKGYKFSN